MNMWEVVGSVCYIVGILLFVAFIVAQKFLF